MILAREDGEPVAVCADYAYTDDNRPDLQDEPEVRRLNAAR